MPITVAFKTLTQANFSLDLDENSTISDVKKKVAEGRGDEFAPELQKLIYNGKILEDSTKVSEANFESNKFVVVMLTKRKVPVSAETTSTATPSVTATPQAAPKPEAVQSTPATAAPPSSTPAAPARPSQSTSFTEEQERSIEAICGMGYPKDQVVAALRAAYWNGDRAVEFLISGIPEMAADDAAIGGEEPGLNLVDDDEAPGDLSALQNLPQLEDIRALVQQNPEMLAMVLQQLAASNPALVQAIQNNQQQFINLINGVGEGQATTRARAPGAANTDTAPQAEGQQPRRHVIELTQTEMEAINRIKSMGFQVPDQVIIEAYLACDKNEDAAVDFILNNMDDQ